MAEQNLANKVAVVEDGAEALDYLYHRGRFNGRGRGNPSLVLLDLKIPKVSGLEVLKIIKADEDLKIIPVVVFSSWRGAPDLIECYKHGVNTYVVKPLDSVDFMKAVQQLGICWAAGNRTAATRKASRGVRCKAVKPFLPQRKRSKMKSPLHILHSGG